MGTVNAITAPALRRLAELRSERAPVLSVYLNLDPARFATAPARASAITSLLDDAGRQVERAGLGHEQHMALRADLERVAAHLRDGGFAHGAHGLAVFCCSELELFDSLALPHPVESLVVIDAAPFIAPLAEVGPAPGRWCVAVVNRRVTRVLRGAPERLVEASAFGDDVHGQHSQGGWSQARYERSVEQDVDDHLRRTASVLLAHLRRRPFDALVLVAPKELERRAVEALHPYLRERLVATLALDVESASAEEVRERLQGEIAALEAARGEAALARFRGAFGAGERAAAGPAEVFGALNEQRVETLLYHRGARIAGGVCPRCGLMSADGGDCPADGIALEAHADMLEVALQAAIGQAAQALAIEGPELGPVGELAALLRF